MAAGEASSLVKVVSKICTTKWPEFHSAKILTTFEAVLGMKKAAEKKNKQYLSFLSCLNHSLFTSYKAVVS